MTKGKYSKSMVMKYVKELKHKLPHQSKVYNQMDKSEQQLFIKEYNRFNIKEMNKKWGYGLSDTQEELLLSYLNTKNNSFFSPENFSIKNPAQFEELIKDFNFNEVDIIPFKQNIELPQFLKDAKKNLHIEILSKEDHLKKAEHLIDAKLILDKELVLLEEEINNLENNLKKSSSEEQENIIGDLKLLNIQKEALLISFDHVNQEAKEHILFGNDLYDVIYGNINNVYEIQSKENFIKNNLNKIDKEEEEYNNKLNSLKDNDPLKQKLIQERKKSNINEIKENLENKLIQLKEVKEEAIDNFNKSPQGQLKKLNKEIRSLNSINTLIENQRNDLYIHINELSDIDKQIRENSMNIEKLSNPNLEKILNKQTKDLESQKEKLKHFIAISLKKSDLSDMPLSLQKEFKKDLSNSKDKNLGKKINDINIELSNLKSLMNSSPKENKKSIGREIYKLNKTKQELNYYNNLSKDPNKIIKKNNQELEKYKTSQNKLKNKINNNQNKAKKIVNKIKQSPNEKKYNSLLKKYKSKSLINRALTYPFKSKERRELELIKRKVILDKLNKQSLLKRFSSKAIFYTKNYAKDAVLGTTKGVIKAPSIIARDSFQKIISHPLHNAKVDLFLTFTPTKKLKKKVFKYLGGKRKKSYYSDVFAKNTWWG